jgi:cathepsin L
MRGLILCAVLLGVALATEYDSAWAAWKLKYNKKYDNLVEESYRKQVWIQHAKEVALHNLEYDMGLHTYTQGMNEFVDMTGDEFRAQRLGYRMALSGELNFEETETLEPGTPATQDWTSAGYVTAVKDQGQCGSCWSFSTTGSSESACAILQGKSTLLSLSEQDLVSCDKTNGGCNGGNYFSAFTYFQQNGAVAESTYPYTSGNGVTGACITSKQSPVARKLTGHTATTPGSETALQNAVGNIGPCSVAIDASHSSFQRYTSGIYYEPACSSTNLDHAVLTVGYNADSQGQYWIVKNSWGTSWGQKGYIWMARNRNNNCGIATQPGYPTCSKTN